ncbi:hypothetical protein F0365_09270 [Nonlabens sp. Ci31]|uniref:hypothetical protein n=1 Tax=Nonlabens sp. Ci31 TaxID=2608253 RepID=UPI001463E36B|nr:hypothetical protein [Nonlabens sp. Ci31]QJP34570.1 hypothetical protein F0365_09270 [Nonlabens sp. Ci31]
MKKWIFTALLLCAGIGSAFAQAKDFDGLWEGTLNKADGGTVFVRLFVEENNVYMTRTDDDGDLIKDFSKEVMMSKGYGGQLNAFWMDTGGVWTETQFYSLSWTSEDELSIYHTRHVSNEDGNGYSDWGYSATGTLKK